MLRARLLFAHLLLIVALAEATTLEPVGVLLALLMTKVARTGAMTALAPTPRTITGAVAAIGQVKPAAMTKVERLANIAAATAFNHTRTLPQELRSVPPHYRWRKLGPEVAQFYGAIGSVLCTTLWDPGCSDNFITPAFAETLVRRGARWCFCAPLTVDHGSGEKGGVTGAAPAVRYLHADIALVQKGLTYTARLG